MIEIDGVCYADSKEPLIGVSGVRALPDYRLWLRFTNGEQRMFDMRPYLSRGPFVPLQDIEAFETVYIDHNDIFWLDGAIDFAPETLFEDSVPL